MILQELTFSIASGRCLMNKKDHYLYWLDIAEYDLVTADSMYTSGRYLYVVFMCQQALEKLAKGLYAFYIDESVPRVHNISFILGKVTETINVITEEETLALFDKLAAYYVQGRYPSFKEKISQTIDENEAKDILRASKEAFQWIISLKK